MAKPRTKKASSRSLRKAHLSAKVDDCIVDLFGENWRRESGIASNKVAEHFFKRFPEIVREFGDGMMFGHIVNIASTRLRQGSALLRVAGARVLVLPGIDDTILANLPPLITFKNARGVEVHKPLTHARVWELRAYWILLDEQRRADKVHFDAVTFLKELVAGSDGAERVPAACLAAMKAPA